MEKKNSPEVIDHELETAIKKTIAVLVESSARLNNALHEIECKHPHACEKALQTEMYAIKGVALDLSGQWEELTMTISAGDYFCMFENSGVSA